MMSWLMDEDDELLMDGDLLTDGKLLTDDELLMQMAN